MENQLNLSCFGGRAVPRRPPLLVPTEPLSPDSLLHGAAGQGRHRRELMRKGLVTLLPSVEGAAPSLTCVCSAGGYQLAPLAPRLARHSWATQHCKTVAESSYRWPPGLRSIDNRATACYLVAGRYLEDHTGFMFSLMGFHVFPFRDMFKRFHMPHLMQDQSGQ